MHRDADRASLIGDRTRNGLANPPGRIRGEFEALRIVELLDCTDKAEVAFLDEIEEQHAATDVALRDGNDEAKVRFDDLLLGIETNLLDAGQAAAFAAFELDAFLFGSLELFGRLDAGFHLHGKIDFLGGGQKRHFADLLEVHAHRVARKHGDRRIG